MKTRISLSMQDMTDIERCMSIRDHKYARKICKYMDQANKKPPEYRYENSRIMLSREMVLAVMESLLDYCWGDQVYDPENWPVTSHYHLYKKYDKSLARL